MSLMRRSRLLATTAVSTALALGGLALATGPAEAATSSQQATYSCSGPLGTFQLPATISLSNLPDVLTANLPVPAGTPFSLDFSQNGLSSLLQTLGVTVLGTNLGVNQLTAGSGLAPITSTVTNPLLTAVGNGLLGVDGTFGAFTLSPDGLPIPLSFSLSSLSAIPGLGTLFNSDCTYVPGTSSNVTVVTNNGTTTSAPSGSVVSKQSAKIKAHQVGHAAKMLIKVKNQSGRATGAVRATLHGKKVGAGHLSHGKLKMRLRHLKHGTNRLKVLYQGDSITNPVSKTVRVTVHHR